MPKPKYSFLTILSVTLIGILASLLNIFNILFWAFQIPPKKIFLWVGHYFPDYLTYIQVMTQGARGSWLVDNFYTTDETTGIFLGWWPDLILGKISRIFHISQPFTYWLAVVVFSLILSLLIFYIITLVFPQKAVLVPISAFLLTLFSGPFFEYKSGQFFPYDYWYAPTILFKRFGSIPRHILDQILALLAFIFLVKTISDIRRLSFPQIILRAFLVALPIQIMLTFSLLSAVIAITFFVIGIYYLLFSFLRARELFVRFFIFFFTLALLIAPVALLVKSQAHQPGPLLRGAQWDLSMQAQFTPAFLVLIVGPLLLLTPFGLIKYLKSLSPIRLLLAIFLCVSLVILYTPLGPFLGSASIRFFSPLNWIVFSVLAVVGIEFLSQFLKFKKTRLTVIFVTSLLLLYAVPSHIAFNQGRIKTDRESLHFFNYFPEELYQGFAYLDTHGTLPGAVLNRPEGSLGLVIPIFTKHKAYISPTLFTIGVDKKWTLTLQFYQRKMTPDEALNFLTQNDIDYVIWTYWDGSADPPPSYEFLNPIFKNEAITVYQLKTN